MNIKALGLAATAGLMVAVPALAHHSFSMFDATQTITMKGAVKALDWTNPHCLLQVMVEDKVTGKPMVWALEMSSPARQTAMGMTRNSLKPGDAVTVIYHPMKDGTRGGQFVQAILADGQKIEKGNPSNDVR